MNLSMHVNGAGADAVVEIELSTGGSTEDPFKAVVGGVFPTVESDESSLSSGQPKASFVFV